MALTQRGTVSYEVERTLRTLFKRCLQCPPTTPSCPACSDTEICSLVPGDCNTCAHMICIKNPSPPPASSGPNVGAIAGGVVGGVAFVAIVVFFIWRFWIKKRREQQDHELEEEWESDEIAHQKAVHQMSAMHDTASTRTRGSLANSFLSRASNIIQIAYIPGVTNRNGSGHNSLLVAPVPPIPAAHRSQPPKSPLSNEGDALFFRPGDLRDSSYSASSSLSAPGNRDTRYTMQSITPSLARDSMASDVYHDNPPPSVPATTVMRAAPRMVSVKSSNSLGSDSQGSGSGSEGPSATANPPQPKGVQVMMPGQSDKSSPGSSLHTHGSQYGKAKQVTVGSKGRFPIRQASGASGTSANHMPNVSSPLAERDEDPTDQGIEEEEVSTHDFAAATPDAQPAESPFFDASEHPSAAIAAASSTRPNPYKSMASSIGTSAEHPSKRVGKGNSGLSDILEEATKRASRVPEHDGLGGVGKRDESPFGDEHEA